MKWFLLPLLFLAVFVAGCDVSVSAGNPSPPKAVEMYAESRLIGGPSLAIEIKPGNQTEADKFYIVSISEKGRGGRWRTYVTWTRAELNVSRVSTIYMPLSRNEFNAYFNESDKLGNIFSVMIEPRALTKTEIDDMISKKIIAGH